MNETLVPRWPDREVKTYKPPYHVYTTDMGRWTASFEYMFDAVAFTKSLLYPGYAIVVDDDGFLWYHDHAWDWTR